MGLFRRRKNVDEDEPYDPEERSPQLGLRNKDLAVLGRLMQAGADLSRPRHAVYFLYFANLSAATLAADEAGAAGWSAEVRDPVPDDAASWCLACERPDVVLTPDFVREVDDFFQGLADRFAGDYDGWEAAV